MEKKPKDQTWGQHNEGEGNKTAARKHNKAQREFVRSVKVDDNAHAAEKALDSAERSEIEDAQLVGERHR